MCRSYIPTMKHAVSYKSAELVQVAKRRRTGLEGADPLVGA